jgi:hypothetical protein
VRTIAVASCLGLAALMGCGSDDNNNSAAQAKTFTVPLSTTGETPVCPAVPANGDGTGPGPNATGSATVTISADNSTVTVNATYSGLSGPAILGHIHSGTAAAAGPVVLPFPAPLTSPFSATLNASNFTVPASGTPADFATFVTALKNGGAGYVNFHTANCPAGEIRGEIQ